MGKNFRRFIMIDGLKFISNYINLGFLPLPIVYMQQAKRL